MNHPGNRTYPLYAPDNTPMIDVGFPTKQQQTGIARGGIVKDYNVKLRGFGQRIDEKPKRPYP